eukprot:6059284-Amphidinium_carterae.1
MGSIAWHSWKNGCWSPQLVALKIPQTSHAAEGSKDSPAGSWRVRGDSKDKAGGHCRSPQR